MRVGHRVLGVQPAVVWVWVVVVCWSGLADISVSSLPAVHGIKWTCSNGNSSSGFSVEQLVQQILDSHQTKPPPRTHNCLCTGTLGKGEGIGGR